MTALGLVTALVDAFVAGWFVARAWYATSSARRACESLVAGAWLGFALLMLGAPPDALAVGLASVGAFLVGFYVLR